MGCLFFDSLFLKNQRSNRIYTSAFYDLTADCNQRTFYSNNNFAQDRVSGFTIKQVQDIIKGSESWGEIKGKLRSQHPCICKQKLTLSYATFFLIKFVNSFIIES